MGTPVGWDTREPLCGVGDPFGREDTANKYVRTLWDNITAEHNEDGTHKTDAVLAAFEQGEYTGNGSARTITLTETDLLIKEIMIIANLTESPVMASASMTADNTKEFGLEAFQSNQITSISTRGQFNVGTDATVNQNGAEYHYMVWGTLT